MFGRLVLSFFVLFLFLFSGAGLALAKDIQLSWNPSPSSGVTGYKVYYEGDSKGLPLTGTGCAQGRSPVDAGNKTSLTLRGLDPGKRYSFAVTAYNDSAESPYSTIVTEDDSTSSSSSASDSLQPISQAGWKLKYVDSEELKAENNAAVRVFDGNPGTIWHTSWSSGSNPAPHEIQIDLGKVYPVAGFEYLPRQDGGINGTVGRYEFYLSGDGSSWGSPVVSGSFPNNTSAKEVVFSREKARFIRFRALSEVNGNPWTSMAELKVFAALGTATLPASDDKNGDSDKVSTPDSSPSGADSSQSSSQNKWRLIYVDSEELQRGNGAAINAFDGDPTTIWHTSWSSGSDPVPHEIQIDLGAARSIEGFRYLPRQDGGINGTVGRYEFYVGNDLSSWGSPVATGTFSGGSAEKKVVFDQKTGRYIRFRALSEVNGKPWTSMAELKLIEAAGDDAPPGEEENASPAMAAGQVDINHRWKTVKLSRDFNDPVVIVGAPSYRDAEAGLVRIRNVRSNTFDIQFAEWSYADGVHDTETVSYLVLERGRHEMPDGSIWEAGSFYLGRTGVLNSQNYFQSFSGAPALLLTVQTCDEPEKAVVARGKNVDGHGFEAGLFTQESLMGSHDQEEVGYLAVWKADKLGTVSVNGRSERYAMDVLDIGSSFKALGTVAVKLEEDQSADTEVVHAIEKVSVVQVGRHLFFQPVSCNELDTVTVRLSEDGVPETGGGEVIPQKSWRLLYTDSEELSRENGAAVNAFDGNPKTIWHTSWSSGSDPVPHEIRIDLGAVYSVGGFRYLPRQDGGTNGTIKRYAFYVSGDGSSWGSPVATGSFTRDLEEQEVLFTQRDVRFVRLRAVSEINDNPWTTVAELNVITGSRN